MARVARPCAADVSSVVNAEIATGCPGSYAAAAIVGVGDLSIGYAGYHWLAGTIRRDISFGLQLHFSLYLFSALALINAICLVGFGWRRAGLISLGVCLGLWALFWLNILLAMPYRSLLVLAAGGFALAVPWVWLWRRRCA